jgi:hypothetical protein
MRDASASILPSTTSDIWPALPLGEWRDTYATLHRWLQIVGKTRLALAPMQNHYWHCALYLTARGLGTSPMHFGDECVEVELDFIDHSLLIRTSRGDTRSLPLRACSVAAFYREYVALLRSLDIRPRIWPVPVELPDTLRFDEDDEHRWYDADAAYRCWRILAGCDRVLKKFRGAFVGKSSPSHFWWGSFDLACTRFSGRRAPTHPGGVPNCPDYVTREAYSHECISVGWWPGTVGGLEEPAFYAYSYPEPPGCAKAPIAPAAAYYHSGMREWILPYDAVRIAENPDAALLAFCQSTYTAAADLAHWDRAALERTSMVQSSSREQ